MSMFGWSYPPGCSGPPDDDVNLPPEIEQLLVDMEEMGLDTAFNDRVMKIIDGLLSETRRECSRCLDRYVQQRLEEEAS